jgi:phosphatidyl-myo-inositol dimannoside synthase
MQNVSMQLMQELDANPDVELRSVVQRAPWRNIELSTTYFLFKLLIEIPRAEREFEPDVILFSSMVTAGVLPFLRGKVKAPTVAINHGQDVTLPVDIYQWYLPRIFEKLTAVISVSEATRQASIERGLDPEKGTVLPNGLDEQRSNQMPSREDARKNLGKRFGIEDIEEKYLLLTVGRHVKRKGHAWFIREVMPKLENRVNYLIIGSGPEYQSIKQEADRTSNGNRVILAGRQPNHVLGEAYMGSDLFVMPNIPVEGDMEGFGIVLLEANQCGLPAVASDLEGIRDVIEPGVNGYRVPHSEPAQFAERVDHVLDHELEELSKSAKSHVLKKFSWQEVVRKYVNFLKDVAYERV